jgi:hypothetical protein
MGWGRVDYNVCPTPVVEGVYGSGGVAVEASLRTRGGEEVEYCRWGVAERWVEARPLRSVLGGAGGYVGERRGDLFGWAVRFGEEALYVEVFREGLDVYNYTRERI